MRREEQLELLLEQRGSALAQRSALHAGDAAKLAAADTFARLNAIEIPPDVAQRIEARVYNRVAALQAERQLAQQRRAPERRPIIHRAWIAALAAALLLLLAFLGVANVAASSLPGDPFYGLKRFEQQVAVAMTGDQTAQASLRMTQLQQAIADLSTVVSDHRSDAALEEALAIVAADTQASRDAVHALPAGQPREALAHSLANTLKKEREALHPLLSKVDWSQQLAFTHQLGVLGEPIPAIVQVMTVESTGNTFILHVTGKNFAPGARLVINGSPRGIVLQRTTTALSILVNASDLPQHDAYSIGVVNPDGTAAQIELARDQDHHGQSEPGVHHGTPGPTQWSTPEPGDGEHPPMPGNLDGSHH